MKMTGNSRKILAFGAGAILTIIFVKRVKKWYIEYQVGKKIQRKIQHCEAARAEVEEVLRECGMTLNQAKTIVALPFMELQRQLQNGSLYAVQVLHAYQIMALEATDRLNCVTECLPDAEAIAQSLDRLDKKGGPLHGIPVSLKESFELAGNDSSCGLGHWLENYKSQDAVIIQVLKDLGAVPFVRTNLPETLMLGETNNPIFGRTLHPVDPRRTPGGSSGGEAALIGAGASVLGFGSDIGGSIRIPSHFCGCYGLKTTGERMSRKGTASLSKGQTLVSGTVGPMSRDFDGILESFKHCLSDLHFALDPQVAPLKFNDSMFNSKKPLRIGFYAYDGYSRAVPACERAVLIAKDTLEQQGHTLVAFTPPGVIDAIPDLYMKTIQGDHGKQFLLQLQKDIVIPELARIKLCWSIPGWMLWLLSWIVQAVAKDPQLGRALRAPLQLRSIYGWFQQALQLQEFKDKFLAAWREQKLDAVICPVVATVALPNSETVNVPSAFSYTMLYNILNYSAGSMPVTRVTSDDVCNMAKYPNKTSENKCVIKYMQGTEGLPVNVQVVGLPYQEELVLRVMSELDKSLKAEQES
ncbi:vitamin D3 hydroxylase-associated protein-like [Dreissena polymorpha]|nr:vitamin D3 hydroxylase-associated protein-like [Dreissena polymorpha]XP_052237441.1 vitamin D3 hydroxylase-associated protein-like [Dreissena polymorpha]